MQRLKIALVADWYLPRVGGLELHMRDLCRELNAAGHEAHVITATPGEGDDGLTVHRLDVPRVPRLAVVRDQRAALALEALVVREGYDILHGHTAFSPLTQLACRLGRRLGVPTVLTEHSVLRGAGHALLWGLQRLIHWADEPHVLTAVSRRVADEVAQIAGREVHVLHPGIRPEDWRVNRREEGRLRVISVMRLTKRKRPLGLVKAIPAILARLPRGAAPIFTLIGDGPERAAVEREVARLGLQRHVELLGFLPRPRIREMLASSSVFTLATAKEAASIAVIEARCAGVPVVAMRHGGLADLVEDGVEGFLVDDWGAYAGRIAQLLGDEALRARMSLRTAAGVERFAWPQVVARHEALYAHAFAAVGLATPAEPARLKLSA